MSRCTIVLVILGVVAAVSAQLAGNNIMSGVDGGPNDCGNHEEWSICGQVCEPTCKNPLPKGKFCRPLMCNEDTGSCRCVYGYVRDSALTNQCILQANCPAVTN